jgi:hypothetical protein
MLDIGLASDGTIVLRCYDAAVGSTMEITMSVEEARGLVKHLEQVIAVAASLPAGRRISLEEGHA